MHELGASQSSHHPDGRLHRNAYWAVQRSNDPRRLIGWKLATATANTVVTSCRAELPSLSARVGRARVGRGKSAFHVFRGAGGSPACPLVEADSSVLATQPDKAQRKPICSHPTVHVFNTMVHDIRRRTKQGASCVRHVGGSKPPTHQRIAGPAHEGTNSQTCGWGVTMHERLHVLLTL